MEADVINYIKEARTQGITDTEIKQNLLNAGWDPGVVEESFGFVKVSSSKPVPAKDEPVKPAEKPVLQASLVQSASQSVPSEPIAAENLALPAHANTTVQPSPMLAEKDFHGPEHKRPVKKVVLIVAALLVLFGTAGYLAYAYLYTNPTSVWDKFTGSDKSKIYQSDFTASYTDTGTVDAKNNPFTGFEIKDLKLAFNGKFYVDATNEENPQSSSSIKYTFSSGNTEMGAGLDYKLINKILYVNVGNNLLLNNLFRSANPDRQIDWVKLDLNEIQNELESTGTTAQNPGLQNAFTTEWQKEVAAIWEDAKIITVDRYIGKETINDVSTLHFINQIDKEAVRTALRATLDKFITAIEPAVGQTATAEDVANAQVVLDRLVDKIEVKQLETWVGVKDFQLYKIVIVSNAPSFIALMNNSLGEARESSRDAKRLDDVRQLASALELYFNDRGGYPSGSGVPKDISPVYIGQMPVAPSPADGGCTDYYNGYWYEAKGQPSEQLGITVYPDYELTFCLGAPTGGYAGGIARLTPNGIQANIACPSTAEECGTAGQNQAPMPEKTDAQLAEEFVNKLDFSAEFRVDATYSNYGATQTLEAPANAFDLFEAIKGSVMGAFTKALN